MSVRVQAELLLFSSFTSPGALSRVPSFFAGGDHRGSLGLSLFCACIVCVPIVRVPPAPASPSWLLLPVLLGASCPRPGPCHLRQSCPLLALPCSPCLSSAPGLRTLPRALCSRVPTCHASNTCRCSHSRARNRFPSSWARRPTQPRSQFSSTALCTPPTFPSFQPVPVDLLHAPTTPGFPY